MPLKGKTMAEQTEMRMRIEHVALWTQDLERSRRFYETYFGVVANEKYLNRSKAFESCFLRFAGGARLELMQMPGIDEASPRQRIGWAHIAISVGSEQAVDELTERLRRDAYLIASAPRRTGDGYYESVVLDPDGNHLEITV